MDTQTVKIQSKKEHISTSSMHLQNKQDKQQHASKDEQAMQQHFAIQMIELLQLPLS